MAIVTGHKYEYDDVLVNRVKEFLDKAGWHYSFDDDMGVYEFTVRTKSMIKKINYMIDVQGNKILVLGVSPIGANPDDPKMMAELAEFICRSNWSLMNGWLVRIPIVVLLFIMVAIMVSIGWLIESGTAAILLAALLATIIPVVVMVWLLSGRGLNEGMTTMYTNEQLSSDSIKIVQNKDAMYT